MELSESIGNGVTVTCRLVEDDWALAAWELVTKGWTLRGKVIKGKDGGKFASMFSTKLEGKWVHAFTFADKRQEDTVKDTVSRLYDKLIEQKESAPGPIPDGYEDPLAAGGDMPF